MPNISELAPDCLVGIDLGGSTVRVAIVDGATGSVVGSGKTPYRVASAADVPGIARFTRYVVEANGVEWSSIAAVGLGLAGAVHDDTVSLGANIPGIEGAEGIAVMQGMLGRPVTVENDVNAAAFAEWSSGAEQDSVALLSVGTGLGLGLVCGGEVLRGRRGMAGEIGDVLVSPWTDRNLESMAGGEALRLRYQGSHAAWRGTGRDLVTLADGGDADASKILQTQAEAVAWSVTLVQAILDPDRLLLGGGIGGSLGFVADMRRRVADLLPGRDAHLLPAGLGDVGVAVGAALLARRAVGATRAVAGVPELSDADLSLQYPN